MYGQLLNYAHNHTLVSRSHGLLFSCSRSTEVIIMKLDVTMQVTQNEKS